MPGREGRGGCEPSSVLCLLAVGGFNTAWPPEGLLPPAFGPQAHPSKLIPGWSSTQQTLPSLAHDYP